MSRSGYMKNDFARHNSFMTSEDGAKLPVECVLLRNDAVSGRVEEASGETPC